MTYSLCPNDTVEKQGLKCRYLNYNPVLPFHYFISEIVEIIVKILGFGDRFAYECQLYH